MKRQRPEEHSEKNLTLRALLRWLSRLNLATVLIFAIMLFVAIGTCFPQRPAADTVDAEGQDLWLSAVRSKYGRLTDTLTAFGVFRWYRTPIFVGLWGLLVFMTLVCTLNRWHGVWRQGLERSSHYPRNTPYTAQVHTSTEEDLTGVISTCLARCGFHVHYDNAGEMPIVRGDHNRLATLATLLTHLAILLLMIGIALSTVGGWHEQVTLERGETIKVGHGNDLTLRNDDFAILSGPEGNAVNYEAEIMLDGRSCAARSDVLRLNASLSCGGVQVVLLGFAEKADGYSIDLLMVHDPGYPWVIVAGALLCLGVTVTFNWPPTRIYARIEPNGIVAIAGQAARQAYDFGQVFDSAVTELQRVLEAR